MMPVEMEKPRDGLRHRKASDDSDSSSSSPASLPGLLDHFIAK